MTNSASAAVYVHVPTGLKVALSSDGGELVGRVLNIEETNIRDSRALGALLREAGEFFSVEPSAQA